MFDAGDLVRWRKPLPDETGDLMRVIEWNGDRGIVEHLNTGMAIPPTTLVKGGDQIEIVYVMPANLPPSFIDNDHDGLA